MTEEQKIIRNIEKRYLFRRIHHQSLLVTILDVRCTPFFVKMQIKDEVVSPFANNHDFLNTYRWIMGRIRAEINNYYGLNQMVVFDRDPLPQYIFMQGRLYADEGSDVVDPGSDQANQG